MTTGAETLHCPKCEQDLPADQFYFRPDGRPETGCRACRKEARRVWREANRDRVRDKQREWDRRNADKNNAKRRKRRTEWTAEQLEAEAERTRRSTERTRERRIAEYGPPPACACGCGEPVLFDYLGRPNRYLFGHKVDVDKMLSIQYENHYIPAERVRAALQDLRAERGWTVRELAERGGLAYTHMKSVLYDRRTANRFGYDAVWVEHLFRRLNGLAAPPTTYMLRRHAETERRERLLSHELDPKEARHGTTP